ncbi:MAG TPA: SDR family NAD(P)-dependent oxidoreductase [Candidatus Sulfotelmatobacter sp.]|nr:SDR family NAD(P)-dependent oxidoreductase [Candidatus Sulfotelmatobacter sp.]
MGSLVWISGGSSGIGQALARTVPWPDSRLISISRRPAEGIEHLEADLSDPASWPRIAEAFRSELAGFNGDHVAFFQAAGVVQPIGFAGEVDTSAYTTNVLVNSAAPQVLGHMFLQAARGVRADRHLVFFTSGAARTVYPGWSSYGASKAAADQWVRDVGEEQSRRGGVKIWSIAPGTVNTRMQEQLRETKEDDFPQRQKFIDAHEKGKLTDPEEVARTIWELLECQMDNGSVVDLRELATAGR